MAAEADGGRQIAQAASGMASEALTGQEAVTRPQPPSKARGYPLRQFRVLSARNLKIILQDRLSLVLMLALAPVLGLLDFVYGPSLFDPVRGDASKTITVWFMTSVTCVVVVPLGGVREMVKD